MPRAGRKRTRLEAVETHAEENEEMTDAPAGAADGSDADEGENGDTSSQRQTRRWKLPAGYNDENRAFLQAFLAHGSLTFPQAQTLVANVLNVKIQRQMRRRADEDEQGEGGENGTDQPPQESLFKSKDITLDDLNDFVTQAQHVLVPLDFDIRTGTDQKPSPGSNGASRERIWTLVSTDHDPKSHLAVLFTPRKLAFIHRLLTALFDTYNTPRMEAMCITEQQALKLSRPPRSRASDAADSAAAAANRDKGLKHSVVLSLLQSLVRQGWLDKSAQGFYSLGTRALLELESFLVETFNEPGSGWQRIKYCAACRDIVTMGLRCTKTTCTLRLHDHCEAAFWRTQAGASASSSGQRSCPHCKTAWDASHQVDDDVTNGRHYVGERAITSTDVYRRKKRQGRPSEGVDELMRTVLPRTATGGGASASGPGGAGSSMPFRPSRASQAGQGEEEEEEEEEAEPKVEADE